MSSINMQFGNVLGEASKIPGMTLIKSGYLDGATRKEEVLDLAQHMMYILFTREIAISSGNVRGFRARLLARTENDGAVSGGNMYASTNSGVTITANADETLTIKPSSTSYDVYYSLYTVM